MDKSADLKGPTGYRKSCAATPCCCGLLPCCSPVTLPDTAPVTPPAPAVHQSPLCCCPQQLDYVCPCSSPLAWTGTTTRTKSLRACSRPCSGGRRRRSSPASGGRPANGGGGVRGVPALMRPLPASAGAHRRWFRAVGRKPVAKRVKG